MAKDTTTQGLTARGDYSVRPSPDDTSDGALPPDAQRSSKYDPGPMTQRFLLSRLLGFHTGPAHQARMFSQWAGHYFLFSALIAITLLLSLSQTKVLPAFLALVPIVIYTLIDGTRWLGLRNKMPTDDKVTAFRRVTFYLSYGLALYVGITAAWLLSVYTADYLAHLLIWQIAMGLAIGAITGTNALQYGLRLMITMVPIGLMLVQTGDPKYSGLMVLSYLLVFLITLIKLGTSEKLQEIEKTIFGATQAQNYANRRLSEFLSESNNCAWETNRAHQLVYLSENFDRVTGQKIETIMERQKAGDPNCFGTILDPGYQAEMANALRSRRQFSNVEVSVQRQNGKTGWFCVSGKPEFSDDGTFTGYRGWAIDITPSIHTREKLRQYDAVLNQKVEWRTKDLQQEIERLRERETHTNETARERASMLHFLGDHVSTPLGEISNNVLSLLSTHKDEATHAATTIARASNHLGRVIENMLFLTALSRTPAVNQRTRDGEEIVKVDDLIRIAVTQTAHEGRRRGVDIVVDGPSNEKIFCNFSATLKALVELLTNAIENIAENERIIIGATNVTSGLKICIRDTGPEYSQRYINATQGNTLPETNDPSDAVGAILGITIAARVALTHGGSVSIERKRNTNNNAFNVVTLSLPKTRLMTGINL